METLDHKALELVYKNATSEEELEASLEYHGLGRDKFFEMAESEKWTPGPMAANMLVSIQGLVEVKPEDIDASNKASIRRMHCILELSVTKLHSDIDEHNLSTPAIIDQLETLIKMREKLTKLEMPLYGLTTSEPLAIVNPFNLVMATQKDVDAHMEENK